MLPNKCKKIGAEWVHRQSNRCLLSNGDHNATSIFGKKKKKGKKNRSWQWLCSKSRVSPSTSTSDRHRNQTSQPIYMFGPWRADLIQKTHSSELFFLLIFILIFLFINFSTLIPFVWLFVSDGDTEWWRKCFCESLGLHVATLGSPGAFEPKIARMNAFFHALCSFCWLIRVVTSFVGILVYSNRSTMQSLCNEFFNVGWVYLLGWLWIKH